MIREQNKNKGVKNLVALLGESTLIITTNCTIGY